MVIDGEVVGRPTDAPPLPPPPPGPPPRRRRWPWIVGGIAAGMALCLAVPVAVIVTVFVLPIARDTIEAGKGANAPLEALEVFRESFNYSGRHGEMMAARTVTGRHAEDILSKRATFLADRDRDIAADPGWVWGEIKVGFVADGSDEPLETRIDDTHARTVMWVSVGGHPNDGRTDGWYTSSMPWRAEAVRQRDGWRLTEVTMPTWCGVVLPDGSVTGYSKCP